MDGSAKMQRSPGDFLKEIIGKRVMVKLNSGASYRGTLSCLDGYLNIALENAEEWSDKKERTFNETFIRGSNGTRYQSISSVFFI
jgi:U6 snRNA-associated Sm-like protein LSm6